MLFFFFVLLLEKVLLTMVTKTMQLHVMPRLAKAITLPINFDLWMSRGNVDTFSFVINYLNESWMP
jgi:hypothetical protein